MTHYAKALSIIREIVNDEELGLGEDVLPLAIIETIAESVADEIDGIVHNMKTDLARILEGIIDRLD